MISTIAHENYLEGVKEDAAEMAKILSEIPESKKECVLMLVRGFKLGMDSKKISGDLYKSVV